MAKGNFSREEFGRIQEAFRFLFEEEEGISDWHTGTLDVFGEGYAIIWAYLDGRLEQDVDDGRLDIGRSITQTVYRILMDD